MTTALEGSEGSTSRRGPFFTAGKDRVPIVQEAVWVPGSIWTGAENLAPTGIRSPDPPACSQSLYRLRQPAHCFCQYMLPILQSAGRRYMCHFNSDPLPQPVSLLKSLFPYSSSFSSSKGPLTVVSPKRLQYGPILFQSESRIRFILINNDAIISRINEVVHRCHMSCILLFHLEQIFLLTSRLHFILFAVFCGVTPCNLIDLYHRFGRAHCLRLQDPSLVAEESYGCNFSRQMWAQYLCKSADCCLPNSFQSTIRTAHGFFVSLGLTNNQY